MYTRFWLLFAAITQIGFSRSLQAQAQGLPYTQGSVWTLTMVRTTPGFDDDYLRSLATTWRRVADEAKKQGLVQSYKILSANASGPEDWYSAEGHRRARYPAPIGDQADGDPADYWDQGRPGDISQVVLDQLRTPLNRRWAAQLNSLPGPPLLRHVAGLYTVEVAMRSKLVLALLALPIASLPAQQSKKATVVTPDAIQWGPAPAMLPAGAKVAVLDGDPTKPGLFTMRLSVPDGYRIPPHYHPADEHVTVISGMFQVGMGDKFDESKLSTLSPGTFGMIPAGMRHFALAQGPTVLQLHGIGPWKLIYVNPADQPKGTSSQ